MPARGGIAGTLELTMPAKPTSSAVDLAAEDQRNRLISENLRRVFLLIYRMVGNVADAQDLTQEAFIKVLQRGDQLKESQKAAHWLSRIASNTAIDFLRRKRRVNFLEISEIPEPAVHGDQSPERTLLRGEQRRYLDDGLDILTERERTALLLRDVEELPVEEVAERLGCSKATVRSHIANARVKFRRFMEEREAREGGPR